MPARLDFWQALLKENGAKRRLTQAMGHMGDEQIEPYFKHS